MKYRFRENNCLDTFDCVLIACRKYQHANAHVDNSYFKIKLQKLYRITEKKKNEKKHLPKL